MSFLDLFDQTSYRLTETLLHFLWEGFAIGLVAAALARGFRAATAQVRYGIHAVSLALMALCVPITFVWISSSETPPEELRTEQVGSLPVSEAPPEVVLASEPGILRSPSAPGVRGPLPEGPPGPPVNRREAVVTVGASPFADLLRRASPFAASAYLLGVLAMWGRLCCALWGVQRLRRCAVPVGDPQLLSQIARQARRIGLKAVPVVAWCERVTIPVVAGVLRPMILLPAWITLRLEPEEVHVILAHEMAHIRRFDVLVSLLQRLLETLLFFHPMVWHVSRQLSFERENCCDDAVLQAGHTRLEYAGTLVRMAQLCAAARRPAAATPLAALAVSGENGTQLKRRVLRLIDSEQPLHRTRADSLTLALSAGLIAVSLAGVWQARASAVALEPDTKNPAALTQDTSASDGKSVPGRSQPADAERVDSQFSGIVLDQDGKPVTGAEIWHALPAADGRDPGARETVHRVAQSDAAGKFTFRLAAVDWGTPVTAPELLAKAPGYGWDSLPLAVFEEAPASGAIERLPRRVGLAQRIDRTFGRGRFAGRSLKLPREAGPVQGRLVDGEGRPLSGVAVIVESVKNVDRKKVDEAKFMTDLANSSIERRGRPELGIGPAEWQTLIPPLRTNANGEFSLPGLGRDQMASVILSGERIDAERLYIVAREMELKRLPQIEFYPNGAQALLVGLRFVHSVGAAVPVVGRVTEFQSGKPIAGATVLVERLFRKEGSGDVKLRLWTQHIRAVTDAEGRYRLTGIPPGEGHVLNVVPPRSEPWLMAEQDFSVEANRQEAIVDIRVFRGIWLEGRVTDQGTGEPIGGFVDYLALRSNPNTPERFGLGETWEMERFPIDGSGRYRVPGLPGQGLLLVRSFAEYAYPREVGLQSVDGYDPKRRYIATSPRTLPSVNWNLFRQIDPPVGSESHVLDLTLSAGPSVTGRVRLPEGTPVTAVELTGAVEKLDRFEPIENDVFTVHNYEPAVPRNIFFRTPDDALVGYLRLSGEPPADLTVTLEPAVKVKGRLIETETGDPAVEYEPYCRSTTKGDFRFGRTTTDDQGRFEIKGLLAGNVYTADASSPKRFSNGKNGFTIDLTNAKPGETIELGDVTGKNAKPPMK